MRSNPIKRNAMAVAVALTICAGNVLAAVETNAPEVFEQDGKMLFDPAFKAAGYQLKIVGPGNFHRQMLFAGDEALSVSVKSLGKLMDGRYKYEITAVNGFTRRSNGDEPKLAPALDTSGSSGSFSIVGGQLLLADSKLPEPDPVKGDQDQLSLAKDQVIADDLIVDGSACIGFDCVNGESFGFDTIRLKENNVRIKFDDTSNSGSFPYVDWQLTANDSANGGANKFSIDDITNSRTPFTVEAGTPSNSLFLDSSGKVGFRTSTPVLDLHVKTGNTPGLRLDQDGSSGFAAQTWDVAANETNFFIRDVSNGSTLPFRIRPGAPTSSIDIAADGDIGMGTTSPEGALHVNRSGIVLGYIQSSSNEPVQLRFKTESSNRRFLALDGSGNVESQIEFGDNGVVTFFGPTVADTNVVISNDGLNVNGTISLNGGQIHPDYVFGKDYSLPSIEEHADYMWSNAHLPKVGAATVGADGLPTLDIGKKTLGMLEELEIAHIYIDELNKKITSQNETIDSMTKRLEELEKKLDR